MKAHINGAWVETKDKIEVVNPFDQSVIDTVPRCGPDEVDRALAGAVEGAKIMKSTTGYDRSQMLRRVAVRMNEMVDELARTISMEEGKILAEARTEVTRAAEVIDLSADEAKRLGGEVLPLDGAPGGAGRLGFTLRVPCGVVLAITPFNFPLNLVCHKVGPALAGGNAVVIKPATDTPLSALKFVEILLECGFPPLAVSCLTGAGSKVGDPLAADPRVRKISFTGSRDVGEHICKVAGLKKVTMELGSNSPLIVMDDADLERVAEATVATGFANAGQVCISTQRVIAVKKVYGDLLDVLAPKVAALTTGDQLKDGTKVGPMVRTADAERVSEWIDEAVAGGARVVTGGERDGACITPMVVADVKADMRISYDEIFGPAVAAISASNIDEAIALANDTRYGLSAGVFTSDLNNAVRFAREIESGNIHINWGPQWRADLMPYGGLKESGMGKEGPKYVIDEMTEMKTGYTTGNVTHIGDRRVGTGKLDLNFVNEGDIYQTNDWSALTSSEPFFAQINLPEVEYDIYDRKSAEKPRVKWMLAAGTLTGPAAELMQPLPEELLYDTRSDPHEIHNLAESTKVVHQEALIRLRAALDTWIVETGDQGQWPEPAEIVAPFEQEMHDWFGTPEWYRDE
ncbi:Lactaldehyde dehydrogenase [Durusdinium trenchii]|uniref:NADP-dependent glyceraldehyde-3-phosphate dehydrogenase n=1 Tax=Durusdinium trenchii TaxID=1381693 RepID=A0ABP0M215_9DINO